MKNPTQKSKDRIIEAFEKELIEACCPDGNIPNSRVARQVEKARATAVLKYAKMQNKPVAFVKQGNCQFKQELSQNKIRAEKAEYKTASNSAKHLKISLYALNKLKDEGKIKPIQVNDRLQYRIEDLNMLQNTTLLFA
ncbi:hypothetical protein MP478_04485 [Chryseobacterium sp. WG14]|uniref:hypothetical protein n=1 Tax=Chryseobacterium sp. WG14 TaxID=2926909 RepID=UPI00211ECB3D|nr:hypothetical protein [Chryseobacterium sp. WG14]MCQ9638638.1 hypothetical protein [Chryseobacterium sp. WG14]